VRSAKKILESTEGLTVVIPEKSIEEAMVAIVARYESQEAFEKDLAANNLTPATLAPALEVDLIVEAAMTLVALRASPPDEEQVAQYFEAAEKEKPEERSLRHILITINEQFPENHRKMALARISKIKEKSLVPDTDFSQLAQYYSECPSALQGGTLPSVIHNKIDSRIGDVLFSMEVGEISEVVESAMGFHILFCEKIKRAERMDFDTIKAGIRKQLHTRNQNKEVQRWLKSL